MTALEADVLKSNAELEQARAGCQAAHERLKELQSPAAITEAAPQATPVPKEAVDPWRVINAVLPLLASPTSALAPMSADDSKALGDLQRAGDAAAVARPR